MLRIQDVESRLLHMVMTHSVPRMFCLFMILNGSQFGPDLSNNEQTLPLFPVRSRAVCVERLEGSIVHNILYILNYMVILSSRILSYGSRNVAGGFDIHIGLVYYREFVVRSGLLFVPTIKALKWTAFVVLSWLLFIKRGEPRNLIITQQGQE